MVIEKASSPSFLAVLGTSASEGGEGGIDFVDPREVDPASPIMRPFGLFCFLANPFQAEVGLSTK
jgi:hypothetical protein